MAQTSNAFCGRASIVLPEGDPLRLVNCSLHVQHDRFVRMLRKRIKHYSRDRLRQAAVYPLIV